MNKKLLSIAVAASLATPLSAMAASDVTLYGRAHISQDKVNADNFAGRGPGDVPFTPYDGWDTVTRASRLGVKGSEDLGGGLKAIFKIELQVDMANANDRLADNDPARLRYRNTYVGLTDFWGTALIGRHDTPLKISTGRLDLFADRLADYNFTVGFFDVRADNTIAYITPDWKGFTFAGALVSPGGATSFASPLTGEFGNENGADGLVDAFSTALMYSNGPWFGSLAYEQYKDDAVSSTADDNFKILRAGFGMDLEAFTLNLIYEARKDDPIAEGQCADSNLFRGITDSELGRRVACARAYGSDDPKLYQVQGAYKFGNNAIKGMWGKYKGDDAEDHSSWALGLDHNFSRRTTLYLMYSNYDSDNRNSDWKGGSLGLIHNF